MDNGASIGEATARLTSYLAGPRPPRPDEVVQRTKNHILDTLAAMVSGLTLLPGQMSLKYAALQGSGADATIVGRQGKATAITAAVANGMLAHADETDDSHFAASMHPGCAILPAALAMAEKNDRSGAQLLDAVAIGYDVGARMMRAARPLKTGMTGQLGAGFRFDGHAVGGTFGAAAAAGVNAAEPFDQRQWGHLLSFAAHQASGMPSYPLDSLHVEKAFIFGGMPARNGITAATMIEAGFSGIDNDIEGPGGWLACFGTEDMDSSQIGADLGERFEILNTNIKKYCVGSPCQAAVDCLVNLIDQHGIGPDDVDRMVMYAANGETAVTRADQPMPDLNVRYLLSVTLIDGRLGFIAGHDEARMDQPEVRRIRDTITIETDRSLANEESPRQAALEVFLRDGRVLREHVVKVRGVTENPMTTAEVVDKARELLELGLDASRAEQIIERVLDLESQERVSDITALLRN